MLKYVFMKIILIQYCFVVSKEHKSCDSFSCSGVYDPVCGLITLSNEARILKIFNNECWFLKTKCDVAGPTVSVQLTQPHHCGLPRTSGRRIADHSIVGSAQTCNHSCPIHCTDAYEPTCVMFNYRVRFMLNHCHVDMFSCVSGFKVIIMQIASCYPSNQNFRNLVAGLQTMKMIDRGRNRTSNAG